MIIVRQGWVLKIYNENCMDVLSRLHDCSIDLLCTDPPYRIASGGCTIKERPDEMGGMMSKRSFGFAALSNSDDVKGGKLFKHNEIKFSEWLPEVYRVLKDGAHAYIMINARNLCELQTEAERGA